MPQIVLEPHNPAWAGEFAEAKFHLQNILANIPIICIEHIGSTSIPDLIAKPIIDIDIEILPENFEPVRDALVRAGYRWIGESGIPGRSAFWQPGSGDGGQPAHGERRRNTYVVNAGCLSLRNHRDLKRILIEDAELRKEYGDVKVSLVMDIWVQSVEDYCSGKNEIVSKILKRAGWSQEDLDVVTKSNFYARGLLGGI